MTEMLEWDYSDTCFDVNADDKFTQVYDYVFRLSDHEALLR